MQPAVAPLNIVDAHHHFWDPSAGYAWMHTGAVKFPGDTGAVCKRYEAEDLRREAEEPSPLLPSPLRLAGSVHLQCGRNPAAPADESLWVQQQSERCGLPVAIVAYASLANPRLDELLQAHAVCASFRGVRQMLNWGDDERYRMCERGDQLRDPAWQRGFALLGRRNLSFDLQLNSWQLDDAARLLSAHPDTRVVLNHAGLPFDYRDQGFAGWRRGITELAAHPQVCVKFSGLGMVDRHWTPASVRPVFDALVDSFGLERIMFGSNFPIDRLYLSYAQQYGHYLSLCEGLRPAQRHALFAGTANRVYRLDLPGI